MWCVTGVWGTGGPFWHRSVQQALTPDFQLGEQISECGRKGPGGPVCNCCSGVCVHDGLWLYWGQSTRMDGPQSSGYKFTVPFQWLWICFSPLMALVFDFLFGLYATTYPAGLLKVHGPSVWLLNNDPFTCSVLHSKHQLITTKRNIQALHFQVLLRHFLSIDTVLLATLKCTFVLHRFNRFHSCFLWFLLLQTQAKKQIKPNLAAPLIFNCLPNVHIVTQYNSLNTLWELLPKNKKGVKALNTASVMVLLISHFVFSLLLFQFFTVTFILHNICWTVQ